MSGYVRWFWIFRECLGLGGGLGCLVSSKKKGSLKQPSVSGGPVGLVWTVSCVKSRLSGGSTILWALDCEGENMASPGRQARATACMSSLLSTAGVMPKVLVMVTHNDGQQLRSKSKPLYVVPCQGICHSRKDTKILERNHKGGEVCFASQGWRLQSLVTCFSCLQDRDEAVRPGRSIQGLMARKQRREKAQDAGVHTSGDLTSSLQIRCFCL